MFAPPSDPAQDIQATTQLEPNSRVRFWSPKLQNNPHIAVVREIHEEEIILQVEGQSSQMRAQFVDRDRLEVSVKPARNNVRKGAIWGSLGLLAATVITMIGDELDDGKSVVVGVTAIGVIGGGIGALVGWAFSSSEQWEEVPLGSLQADQVKLDGGKLTLAVSLRF